MMRGELQAGTVHAVGVDVAGAEEPYGIQIVAIYPNLTFLSFHGIGRLIVLASDIHDLQMSIRQAHADIVQ